MQAPFHNTSRPIEGGYEFDRLRLRFCDDAVEARYRVESLNESRSLIRTYLIAAALLYLMFGILDSVVGGEMVHALWFIRYAGVCSFLVAAGLLTYLPSFKKFSQTVVSIA